MLDQAEKGRIFRDLHAGSELFVIPNPWDAGSAKLLASMGFKALTTTSAGLAFSLGRPDGANVVTRAEALANAAAIVAATDLPVAADLENGYGPRPEDAAETILRAAEVGLVGGSIEDATGNPEKAVFDFNESVERVAAAAEAARSIQTSFIFVARSENFIQRRPDLDDTIRRCQAYEEAGADAVFAPGLPDIAAVRLLVQSVTVPVNVLTSPAYSLQELRDAGVRRVSTGSGFYRAAIAGLLDAANEIQRDGTFGYSRNGMSFNDLNQSMARE